MNSQRFGGFPEECLQFFQKLSLHNNKEWFERHRHEYQLHVLGPARAFVEEMGDRLRAIAPRIIADPRANQSLFRINRDTRFSPIKTPYKTHLALWFWEGALKRMECSGFYFHLEPHLLMLAAGIYRFPRPHLDEYRRSVVHPKHGRTLDAVVSKLSALGSLEGETYKRTPRGYDPAHPRARLLRHDGLYLGVEMPVPRQLHTRALLDFCFDRFKPLLPLHRWLVALTERVSVEPTSSF